MPGFPCRYSHSAMEVCDLADLSALRSCWSKGDRRHRFRASASSGTTIRHEALSRHRHRHFRVEGRARRTRPARLSRMPHDRTRCWCRVRAGPNTAPRKTGGAILSTSPGKCWRQAASIPSRSGPWRRAPSGPACCRWMRTATPLMNGVLYGVDTRAQAEIEELTARIGEDRLLERCGNALTSQSVGPKILWLRRNHPEIFARTDKVMTSTSYHRAKADRRNGHRPLHGGELFAALHHRHAWLGHVACRRHHRGGTPAQASFGPARSPDMSPRKRQRRPALRSARR